MGRVLPESGALNAELLALIHKTSLRRSAALRGGVVESGDLENEAVLAAL